MPLNPRPEVIDRSARFSADWRYRYRLERTLGSPHTHKGIVAFVMLNPSTADETVDDPTIRRCIGYANAWGYRRLIVGNLFAYRATDPRELRRQVDPYGPENAAELRRIVMVADRVVCAWGAHGEYLNAGRNFFLGLRRYGGDKFRAFKMTSKGQPVHPLYQRADLLAEVAL